MSILAMRRAVTQTLHGPPIPRANCLKYRVLPTGVNGCPNPSMNLPARQADELRPWVSYEALHRHSMCALS